ncbi:hypothetical protein GCM10022226_05740 [Sphaerisporangium flaviroseum]|uniref:Uncharacterized protein n=1 Tax=Sphaerisporangium flaviroseum TaxID=509199 RepID=A0ABP7HAP0_9ACTN
MSLLEPARPDSGWAIVHGLDLIGIRGGAPFGHPSRPLNNGAPPGIVSRHPIRARTLISGLVMPVAGLCLRLAAA